MTLLSMSTDVDVMMVKYKELVMISGCGNNGVMVRSVNIEPMNRSEMMMGTTGC